MARIIPDEAELLVNLGKQALVGWPPAPVSSFQVLDLLHICLTLGILTLSQVSLSISTDSPIFLKGGCIQHKKVNYKTGTHERGDQIWFSESSGSGT